MVCISIFKAYDIRGLYPGELNESIVYKIARAFAKFTNAREIVVGGDNRLSTPSLKKNFIKGLIDSGVNVTDIGTVPTSFVYFACYHLKFGAGVMITASHNPKEFNGIKLCDSEGIAIGLENGLDRIEEIVENSEFKSGSGSLKTRNIFDDYYKFISSLSSQRLDFKIVIDGSNGSAGATYSKILGMLGAEVTELFCNPDGNFPNHKTPDPLIEENLARIKEEVKKYNADVGFAFDGDGDRIIAIDENGDRISPNHVLCVLAENYLQKNSGGKVVYDILSSQLVDEVIRKNNGVPVVSKVGHSIVPRTCKKEDAALAGEISAHFFFKEANYTDDALMAAIKLLDILKSSKKPLSSFVENYPKYYQMLEKRIPVSPEEKFKFIESITARFRSEGYEISTLDGVKIKFKNGWAVFRASNTESRIAISYESPDWKEFKEIENFVNETIKLIPSGKTSMKLVIFDFQDVMTNDWRDLFNLPELNIKPSAIAEFFDDHNELRKEMQYGRLEETEFWREFIKHTKFNVTVGQLTSSIRRTLAVNPEMLRMVKSLKKNYKLAILSNFTREWAEFLINEYKLNEIFDDMFWSFQNGVKKPSKEAYLQVVEKFKIRSEECLFIDDKERNIKGAQEIGMKTILYSDPESLRKEMSLLGVNVDG